MAEIHSSSEQEIRKHEWLLQLADFIVEANRKTWAADKGEVEPFLPGHKSHEYQKGDWRLVDDYSGYFQAPGMTIVSYKDLPAWHMYYGGEGMSLSHYDKVQEAFSFLRKALMQVTPQLPLRGPESFDEDNWHYAFKINGTIENCTWEEEVRKGTNKMFKQTGAAGIYIHKTVDKKPLYPWDL